MKNPRIIIALVIAVISAITYFSKSQVNPVTGEKQRIDISAEQEIALGLQAAPEMAQQFGGLDPDERAQGIVDRVGNRILQSSDAKKSPYRYDFHVLADNRTVNAFALPGGQVFITKALLSQLGSEGQLAGVLGHEIGHVVARHSAEQMAKQRFTQGLTGAAVMATIDPGDPSSYRNAAVAQMVGQLVSLKFTRNDELEADKLGVRLMTESGYDPRSMIGVMEVLKRSSGGRGGPDFFQTHPNPENRIEKIKQAIQEEFPQGLPSGLQK
jgi:predicted Zn-dependent protease